MRKAELADIFGKKIVAVTEVNECQCVFQLEEYITVVFWVGDGSLHLSAKEGGAESPDWYGEREFMLW